MKKLIPSLDKAGITWTVENPFTSLLWETLYGQNVGAATSPPWSMTDGAFDTSLEVEYTPMLAKKKLAAPILEAIANAYKLPKVVRYLQGLKLSHSQAIAEAKQPTKAMSIHMIPEFSPCACLVQSALSNIFSVYTFSTCSWRLSKMW